MHEGESQVTRESKWDYGLSNRSCAVPLYGLVPYFQVLENGQSTWDAPGPTGGCQGRSRGVGSNSLESEGSQDTREENRSGCQSRYSNCRTYRRSTTLYTRLELPYKEMAKHRSVLGVRICQLRQYKAMIQECSMEAMSSNGRD